VAQNESKKKNGQCLFTFLFTNSLVVEDSLREDVAYRPSPYRDGDNRILELKGENSRLQNELKLQLERFKASQVSHQLIS